MLQLLGLALVRLLRTENKHTDIVSTENASARNWFFLAKHSSAKKIYWEVRNKVFMVI